MKNNHDQLIDQSQRNQFAELINNNFSVIAPAGVGKTTAIINRIENIAINKPSIIPNIVVITYTKKAADLIKSKVIEKLQKKKS